MNSAPLTVRTRLGAANVLSHVPTRAAKALADPPPGSGLKPVMGERGLPVVGNTFPIVYDTVTQARERYARYGAVSWSNVLRTDFVLVLGPEAIGEVFANRDKAFSSEQGWEHFIGPFFRGGLMLMDFDEHLRHRRIMQQAFKRDRLDAYLRHMNPVIDRELDGWGSGGLVQFHTAMKQLTLGIANEVFLGERLGSECDRLNKAFIDLVAGGQAIVRRSVPGGKWRRGIRGRELLVEYFESKLPEKRANPSDDLFSVLCRAEDEDAGRLTDTEIVDHLVFAMMAAHDTSTATLSTMALQLARNPDWQRRLHEQSIAAGASDLGREDIDELSGLDLVFKESLRMSPPAGMLGRKALKDTEIAGHYIPAGTQLMLALYPSHLMEPWWNDPDRFDPERFSPERAEDKRIKNVWMPFGGHAHKCLGMHFSGMEVKSIMHKLLLRFELQVDDNYTPVTDYGTGPFPGDGLPLRLIPRGDG